MKVQLRKTVRKSIGPEIRSEHVENPGILTVTGLFPSSLDPVPSSVNKESASPKNQPESHQQTSDNLIKGKDEEDKHEASIEQQKDDIVKTLQQRIRYLLTLKGRPPFKLAGIEMYEGLEDMNNSLKFMIEIQNDTRLATLRQGIEQALSEVNGTYNDLSQAAVWLDAIAA